MDFFDVEDGDIWLRDAGDPLEKLDGEVDFEIFRKTLLKALKRFDRANGGRTPCGCGDGV